MFVTLLKKPTSICRREGSAVCVSAGPPAEDPEAYRGGGSGPGSEAEGQAGQYGSWEALSVWFLRPSAVFGLTSVDKS